MLHVGILPHHPAWGELFANLAFVVVDEAHVYRGVFGSHVANVLRRLRRVAAIHGTEPRFLLASATIANPVELAERLTGLTDFNLVDQDGAPRAQPPRRDVEPAAARRGARHPRLGAVRGGRGVLGAGHERRPDDLLHEVAQGRRADPPPLARPARPRDSASGSRPYRGGYTPQQRQDIQRRLSAGELLGVVATDALELGIDVGELDARDLRHVPGHGREPASRCGAAPAARARARRVRGRRGRARPVLLPPPERVPRPAVEAAILDPHSPEIYAEHLLCAAHEAPLSDADDEILGSDWRAYAKELTERGFCASAPPASSPARRRLPRRGPRSVRPRPTASR